MSLATGVGMPQILQPLIPLKSTHEPIEPSEQLLLSGSGDGFDPDEPPDYYQPQTIHIVPQEDSYGDPIPEPQPRQRRYVLLLNDK